MSVKHMSAFPRTIIIIIVTNEEIIVAFSPKTTRTRYKVHYNYITLNKI